MTSKPEPVMLSNLATYYSPSYFLITIPDLKSPFTVLILKNLAGYICYTDIMKCIGTDLISKEQKIFVN